MRTFKNHHYKSGYPFVHELAQGESLKEPYGGYPGPDVYRRVGSRLFVFNINCLVASRHIHTLSSVGLCFLHALVIERAEPLCNVSKAQLTWDAEGVVINASLLRGRFRS